MNRYALSALLVSTACRRAPPPPSPEPKSAADVKLTDVAVANAGVEWRRIEPGAFSGRLRIVANIASDAQHLAQVGARVAGRVSAVSVTLGQHVRRGQTLLEVDTVELHTVTLDYLTAVARARAASDVLARQQQLVAERVGAEADLRKAEAEQAATAASLKEAEEHLHFLGLGYKAIESLKGESTHGEARSTVPSPVDGQVVALHATLGQVLTGNEDVVTVANIDNVWASLRVYERDLANVMVGTPVEVHVAAFPDRPFTSAVSFVSDVVDTTSRSAEARRSLRGASTPT